MSSGLFCVYPAFLLCCLRNPFCFIPSSFRVIFGALLFLSCFSFVLSSELFCVYSVFFPYCLRNRLVLLLSFFRVTFGILLCLFCLSLELLWNPFVFVLFLLCAYFVSVYFLCCFQIVLVFPPFNFYITRRFVFYCFAYVYTCCFVSEAFRGTYSPILCLGERIILRL